MLYLLGTPTLVQATGLAADLSGTKDRATLKIGWVRDEVIGEFRDSEVCFTPETISHLYALNKPQCWWLPINSAFKDGKEDNH